MDALKVRLFSLSSIGMAFSWGSSLTPSPIHSRNHREQNFHDYIIMGPTN